MPKGFKHGLRYHRSYNSWRGMVERCTNPKHKNFPDYGGRGITVCDKWRKFEGFWTDMGSSWVEGLTIDRMDNSAGYFKENCRWADARTQRLNTRLRKDNISGVKGVTWCKRGQKWATTIRVNGVGKHIGYFNTIEEAAEARRKVLDLMAVTEDEWEAMLA